MFRFLSRIWALRPWNRTTSPLSIHTAMALRQLNSRYLRQRRMWIYVILSSTSLICAYVIFAVFLPTLWEGVIPVVCIVVAGTGISVVQVRRCKVVIRMIRQAYAVQVQIDQAAAAAEEKEGREAEASTDAESTPPKSTESPENTGSNGTSSPRTDPSDEDPEG